MVGIFVIGPVYALVERSSLGKTILKEEGEIKDSEKISDIDQYCTVLVETCLIRISRPEISRITNFVRF